MIDINLTGIFLVERLQIPAMLKRGGGSVVNISSILGQVGHEELAPYVAAKHGVVGLTRTVALEYGRSGIRCNAVGPAFIKTRLIDKLPGSVGFGHYFIPDVQGIPLRRPASMNSVLPAAHVKVVVA